MQLSVTNRTAAMSGSFDRNPASVKGWIGALRIAIIAGNTKLLYAAGTPSGIENEALLSGSEPRATSNQSSGKQGTESNDFSYTQN